MSAIKDRNTLVPANADADSITQLYTLLTRDRAAGQDLLVSLAAPSDSNSFAMMPGSMAELFVSMVTALHAGQPITFVPQNATLTTQEAADVLGMSRPTVIKLIDAGDLSCERVGTHRRIPVRDVLALRDQRRAAVQEMLAASSIEDELGTPDEIRASLRAARKSIAKKRRGE